MYTLTCTVIGSDSRIDVFKKIDTSGDGYITKDEFLTALDGLVLEDLTTEKKEAM